MANGNGGARAAANLTADRQARVEQGKVIGELIARVEQVSAQLDDLADRAEENGIVLGELTRTVSTIDASVKNIATQLSALIQRLPAK